MTCPHIPIRAEGDEPRDEIAEDATLLSMLIETTAERIYVRSRARIFGTDSSEGDATDFEDDDEVAKSAIYTARNFWFEAFKMKTEIIDEAITLAKKRQRENEL